MPSDRRFRRLLPLALAGAAFLAPAAARAQFGLPGVPQVVYDPSNFAKNAAQLAEQLNALALQRQQLAQQLRAMRKLTNPPTRSIAATMGQLAEVMAASQAITYALAGADARFATTFPVSRVITDWPAEQRTQAERTVATMRSALAAAGAQAETFGPGMQRVAEMKAALAGAPGHQAALELIGAASIYGAEEMMLLRQALAAQLNVQAVTTAQQVNGEAQRDASTRALLQQMGAPKPRRGTISMRVTP